MIESLLNKALFVIFFMCILNLGKHVWRIITRLRTEDIPNKYELTKNELIMLGLSVAYLVSTIFVGIEL